jgi:parvulin-like peptidyl-prolyl isomerase
VNRRLSLVLSVAAVAALTAGCATFSDSNNVARVGDATLTSDDFQAQLTELGAPSDQLLPAEAVRAQITTWIQEQVAADDSAGIDADEAAARYDAGIESGGTICISGIVVEAEDTANRVADELVAGADFAELLAAENLDPSLGSAGGDIGCITSDQLTEAVDVEFVQVAAGLTADDPIAVSPLFDPEGNEFAWVVLKFRPFAELSAADADTVTAAIDSAARLADADVFVDPRYGTFDAATGQVVALG